MNETSYKIERKVPPPARGPRNIKYPFSNMEVNDSFFIDEPDREKAKSHANDVRMASYRFIQRSQPTWKFSVHLVDGGARCWRTE